MATQHYLRYFWTGIWLGLGTLLGLGFVLWLSISAELNIGLMLLWSFSYLAIGGLLGFIFSVPKLISEVPTVATANALSAEQSVRAKFQENTNLTQISDWLTKVLIGASLVEMKEIPKFVYKIAQIMGNGAQSTLVKAPLYQHYTICCAAIIVYFLTWGFISGYLVMKLVLTEQFIDAGSRDIRTASQTDDAV